MAERLAVEVSLTYESGALGKRGDDTHSCNGTTITRVEFNKSISAKPIDTGFFNLPGLGRGDVYTTDTNLPDIGVHYWLDAGINLHPKSLGRRIVLGKGKLGSLTLFLEELFKKLAPPRIFYSFNIFATQPVKCCM